MKIEYVGLAVALEIHRQTMLATGQPPQALRDERLLESALARPLFAAQYEEADLFGQAATLIWGLAQNQPLVDGNKRTAWMVGVYFLAINGWRVDAPIDEAEQAMLALAGEGGERWGPTDLAAWLGRYVSRGV